MFRLHRSKPTPKSGERIDFRVSDFKAVQVPKGWDKLYLSITSVGSGKTIGKLSKAAVRSGNCQWNEILCQSIWLSQDETSSSSSKELEDYHFKFVLATGSGRSGIIGEATVNLASYMTSSDSVPVSLPLKRCNHETTLQVKVQCLTPKIKPRDEESQESNSGKEDVNADSQGEIKSEESYSTGAKSAASYSSRDLDSTTYQEDEKERGGAEILNSDSNHSNDSAKGSIDDKSFCPSNNGSGDDNNILVQRQDSTSSQNSAPEESYRAENASESNNSSVNLQITHSENLSPEDLPEVAASSLRLSGSSKGLLEAAEDTIQQLRGDAKMWERNARKLMVELEILRKARANLDVELSATCAERDGLQKEVEQLKKLSEKSILKPPTLDYSTLQDKDASQFIKELENDIKFQKESNDSLNLQLKRSQESNAELVSVLQELEETIEKQKAEIENISALQDKFNDMESSIQINLEENRKLMLQMQQLQESEKTLQARVRALEQELEEKTQIIEMESKSNEGPDLVKEIIALKSQLQELESDCQELTDENLELLLKLKEIKNNSTEGTTSVAKFGSDMTDHESQINKLLEKQKIKVLIETENDDSLLIEELKSQKMEMEAKFTEMSGELSEKRAEIERLGVALLSKDEEIENFQLYHRDLESKLSSLLKEKGQPEKNMEIAMQESNAASKCLNDLRKDLMALSSSVDSHFSANKILESKSSELERNKQEMELHLSNLKHENEELSEQRYALEAQLRHLTDERKSLEMELHNSKTHIASIQEKIEILRNEMETQKVVGEQKLGQLHNQWSGAQDECEYLKRENSKLIVEADSLVAECTSLQKSNEELQMQILERHEHCINLEASLSDSNRSFADCSKKVKVLEENISLMLEDSASKETTLISELDALIEENEVQNKRFNMLHQMYLEKAVEVENLHQEVEDLTKQLSVIRDERDRIASEAIHEISGLHAAIVKLQSELNATETESELKVKDLMHELATSKQNLEVMKTDNERISNLLDNYKSSEDKIKTNLNDLELKLTVSEYERLQVLEESNNLKIQLLKIQTLQDEVLSLKNELIVILPEKEKLETSLRQISGQCKELKGEKNLLIEKITSLQKVTSELEDCKRNKISLEEKVLRMEGDLMAKEALCEQYAEVNSELSRIKRSNNQFQRLIQQLEEDKNVILTRAKSLEEQLMLMEEKQNKRGPGRLHYDSNQQKRGGDNGYKTPDKNDPRGDDSAKKIRLLEDELAKATEANNAYKGQLKRLKTEGRKGYIGSPRKGSAEVEVVPREKFERTKSSLEAELKDIQERYLHMSLKYAEVEAEREELVMKLKAVNDGKR